MDLQEVILRLDRFWATKGCLIWQPYNVQVGAGTMNPATVLRVLGPEPWNVGYVEPSVRPQDGRYGKNPNRWGQFYQYQVILKPDPGNPVELYLESLEALGVDRRRHDIRLVEDNWESPVLGAWGLGWEIWMDGQEITQFTYFQQAGGFELDPVSVEITYGLERIVMVLQGARSFVDMTWGHGITYGDMLLASEVEHCTYNFERASVQRVTEMYDLFEAEAKAALQAGLVMPAHDYVLKCSHAFNVLDARGAVGVTQRARYFGRMRDLAREVSRLYSVQRQELGYPLLKEPAQAVSRAPAVAPEAFRREKATLLCEIGVEEMPVGDLEAALQQLRDNLPAALRESRLAFEAVRVEGTARRLVMEVKGLAPSQLEEQRVVKGPPYEIAVDREGRPTKAALGFARSQGVAVDALTQQEIEGKMYLVAVKREGGQPAAQVLAELLPQLFGRFKFGKTMRWNASNVAFSRPVRWILALLGDQVVPFAFAGVVSGRVTFGLRPQGAPPITLQEAADYWPTMTDRSIVVSGEERQQMIAEKARELTAAVGGSIPDDAVLLQEVAHLVEYPSPLLGSFGKEYLDLPPEVLVAVMRKHQRYFPVTADGALLPHFVAVANGPYESLDAIRHGNEQVLRARFADAAFFFKADSLKKLEDFNPRLDTLAFQEKLGSVLDKVGRLERLVVRLGELLGASGDIGTARRAAHLCKADLATQMVVELTSLQGIMGSKYALLSGESPQVARAIHEHYLPRGAGDSLPQTWPGVLVGIADRLDSLVGLFAVGHGPTGSADPYALRRAALAVVQILADGKVSVSLKAILAAAAELQPVAVTRDALKAVHDFVIQRLRVWVLELGYRHDLVDAVLAERGDDPALALSALQALSEWVSRPEFGLALTTYSRPSRIVREYSEQLPLTPDLFEHAEESELYEAVMRAQDQWAAVTDVDGLVAVLTALHDPVARFFDKVFVMVEEDAVRENRLALLQRIAILGRGIVDLTRVQGY